MIQCWVAEITPVVKCFREGTHRSATPEATLRVVAPLIAAAGITRVGMLTGLDVIGIPVAAVYRPNSRTIAVHQGKGVSVAAAKASAVMEAIETFHAETADLPLRLADYATIRRHGEALDPHRLPRLEDRSLTERRMLWTEGRRLTDGATVWVPHDLVVMDLAPDAPPGAFHASTNGLASGNDGVEAVAHALYEVIERDAVARWQAMPAPAQDARAIDLETIADGTARYWLERIHAAGLAVRIWDATSAIAVPVFVCLIAGDDVQPELGFGCHADPVVALLRAISEAAQARLTVISGARDDMAADGYGDAAVSRRRDNARAWLETVAMRDFAAAPNLATDTLNGDVRGTLAAMVEAGYGDAVCIDLTRPDFGIPVVRVVVPGLQLYRSPA